MMVGAASMAIVAAAAVFLKQWPRRTALAWLVCFLGWSTVSWDLGVSSFNACLVLTLWLSAVSVPLALALVAKPSYLRTLLHGAVATASCLVVYGLATVVASRS